MDILGRPKEIANYTKFSTIMYKGISPKCIRIISAKQLSDILSLVIPFTPLLQEKLPAFQERGISYSHPAVAQFCSAASLVSTLDFWLRAMLSDIEEASWASTNHDFNTLGCPVLHLKIQKIEVTNLNMLPVLERRDTRWFYKGSVTLTLAMLLFIRRIVHIAKLPASNNDLVQTLEKQDDGGNFCRWMTRFKTLFPLTFRKWNFPQENIQRLALRASWLSHPNDLSFSIENQFIHCRIIAAREMVQCVLLLPGWEEGGKQLWTLLQKWLWKNDSENVCWL